MFSEQQQIGPYVLIRKIGKGGFGEVWLAEKRTSLVTTRVAIKLPLDEHVDIGAIRHEASLWEKASGHPNVLPIIDADIYDEQVVIVSEFADGGSLKGWLKRHGGRTPSVESATEMILGILNGLVHLHTHKITHRDLKPSNILLHGDTPRIADFGVSRLVEHSSHGTEILGTPAYMSPEAFRRSTAPSTDIWAAGVVFYELLTGRQPFHDDDMFVMMDSIRSDEPEPIGDEVPKYVCEFIRKALEKDPRARFKSAREMRSALLKFRKAARHEQLETKEIEEILNPDDETWKLGDLPEATTRPMRDRYSTDSVETMIRRGYRPDRRGLVRFVIPLLLIGALAVAFAAWQNSASENLPSAPLDVPPQFTDVPVHASAPTASPHAEPTAVERREDIKQTSERRSRTSSRSRAPDSLTPKPSSTQQGVVWRPPANDKEKARRKMADILSN